MAAQEPDAGGATAPAEIAGSEELVITAANVRQVPLDKIPSKTKAWDPIALEVFLEVAEVLFSRWGLLKFVMDEMVSPVLKSRTCEASLHWPPCRRQESNPRKSTTT